MRQMGISTADIVDPAINTSTMKSKHSSKIASRSFEDDSDDDAPAVPARSAKPTSSTPYSAKKDYSTPVITPMAKQPAPVHEKENYSQSVSSARAAAGNNDSARAAFLRSLGIDNMELPPKSDGPTTVSPKQSGPRHASQEFVKSKVAAATFSQEDADPSSFRPAIQPDITLGLRKSSVVKSSPASFRAESPVTATSYQKEPETDGLTVDQIKADGNKAFEQGDFRKAIRLYTKALDRDSQNAALYSNRSASYLQAAKQMGIDTRAMSLRDAEKVVELRPDWFKGYSRKGDALFKLERFSEAASMYERAYALDPENENLAHSLGEARNAAGNIAPDKRCTPWSTAPTSVESLKVSNNKKSAQELLNEMKTTMQKESATCVVVGNDYREAELDRFRSMRSMNSSSSMSKSSSRPSNPSEGPSTSSEASRPHLDKSTIPEEFSGDAAAAYQNSLLEQYRKKKAAQHMKEVSKYM